MNSRLCCIIIIIFFSISFCTTKSENFYLRMQLVEFLRNENGRPFPETVVFEDTVYFNSKNIQSAFEIGNKLAQKRMNENIKSNKIETYFFEINNEKNENIIKYLSDSVVKKFLAKNNNRNRIDSIGLIID